MPKFETVHFPFGKVERRCAPIVSPTLLALPESVRPAAICGCMTCPAASWYHDEERLACHCRARHYVSWLSGQKVIPLCDERETALAEKDQASPGD